MLYLQLHQRRTTAAQHIIMAHSTEVLRTFPTEQLRSMLDFAHRLQQMPNGAIRKLPKHLEEERKRVLLELAGRESRVEDLDF